MAPPQPQLSASFALFFALDHVHKLLGSYSSTNWTTLPRLVWSCYWSCPLWHIYLCPHRLYWKRCGNSYILWFACTAALGQLSHLLRACSGTWSSAIGGWVYMPPATVVNKFPPYSSTNHVMHILCREYLAYQPCTLIIIATTKCTHKINHEELWAGA